MGQPSAIVASLSSAGIGTAVGYIASAMIEARAHRKTKADDAGALVNAATELTDRLLRRNSELAHANATARNALGKLIIAVQKTQDLFERFPEVGDGAFNRELLVTLQLALDAANLVEM
jgi:hypothetical protein